jgi:hypothetical protein
MNISVVPFGKQEAVKAVNASVGRGDISENAHDYAIGATAIILGAKLVTNNIEDFHWMVDVLTPDEVMNNSKKKSIIYHNNLGKMINSRKCPIFRS